MTMPRIWYSPGDDEFYILAKVPFVSQLNNTDNLPDDAVELLPAAENYWELTAEDTTNHLHAAWTFDSDVAAKEWIAGRTKYRNPRLRRASVSRSEWQEVGE